MTNGADTQPVDDSVAKINDELAIGSDPQFQARWTKFERTMWVMLGLFVVLCLGGAFGRGPLANAHDRAADGSIDVQYERVERFETPSILTVHFAPSTVHDGQVQLFTSESLIMPLGTQRVIPQPLRSQIVDGGVLYTFDAMPNRPSVEFAMEPSSLARTQFKMNVPGRAEFRATIFVMP